MKQAVHQADKIEKHKLSLQVNASVNIWLLIDFTDSNEHIQAQFIAFL